jgi:pantoate--beta-alanine ligase
MEKYLTDLVSPGTVIRDVGVMQHTSTGYRAAGKRIATVPTMGALHEGHLELIRRARRLADIVVVSIFVNPTQFAPEEDLDKYPRPFEQDVALAFREGADCIFAPAAQDMFPAGFDTGVSVEKASRPLEGAFRPTHFRGVATVVAKLVNITQPNIVVFGQKDGQQTVVVRRMLRDLNFPIDLVVVPTVRDSDGLALSSRNVYLNPEQRREAPVLFESLALARELIRHGERSCAAILHAMRALIESKSSALIDYVSIADMDTLDEVNNLHEGNSIMISLAVRFGSTRLIDNIHVQL